MSIFDAELTRRLSEIELAGLFREIRTVDSSQSTNIRIQDRDYLNFSSNDYLGLANHPVLKEAAIHAIERFGAGSGASRLISGSLKPHSELDQAIADFKRTEAALSFSSGYATALGTIGALCSKEDVIVLDKLVHASIVDAARLCGAKLRVFPHNDLNKLKEILQWATRGNMRKPAAKNASHVSETGASRGNETHSIDDFQSLPAAHPASGKDRHGSAATSVPLRADPNRNTRRPPNILIVTESIFSMDGDRAALREIADLKDAYGAWLMIDEAHATGLFGTEGRGLADELGLSGRIEIQMGTLGKAVGSAGGFVCGSRKLVNLLVNRARPLIFSTAPVPAAAAAAVAGIQLIRSSEGVSRRQTLGNRIAQVAQGLPVAVAGSETLGAIVPILIGAESKAVEISAALRDLGIYIPAIRYPSVARGKARLRMTLSASHASTDVTRALDALKIVQSP